MQLEKAVYAITRSTLPRWCFTGGFLPSPLRVCRPCVSERSESSIQMHHFPSAFQISPSTLRRKEEVKYLRVRFVFVLLTGVCNNSNRKLPPEEMLFADCFRCRTGTCAATNPRSRFLHFSHVQRLSNSAANTFNHPSMPQCPRYLWAAYIFKARNLEIFSSF